MKPICFPLFAGLLLAVTSSTQAQSGLSSVQLRYQFRPGQTLHYLIQRDPYFTNPTQAIEATDANAPYRPPLLQRLTENVLAVGKDGTATIKITLGPEPGFEDEGAAATVQTVTVTPTGQILPSLGQAPASNFLRAFFRLPTAPVKQSGKNTVLIVQTQPETVAKNSSRGHDGLLLQTTRSVERDSVVFDLSAGNLRKQSSQMTATFSLVMLERGARGAADFGRVIPNVQVVQTMTIERRDDLVSRNRLFPETVSLALAAPRSKN